MQLQTLPIQLDTDAIAKGVLAMMRREDMLDENANNETLIRFGMLPHKWIELLTRRLEGSLRERLRVDEHADKCMCFVDDRIVEFSMRELVSEAVHNVCLALYANVEMVV